MVLHEPEGATPLTPDELQGLKATNITSRGELNELESANIIDGLTWLDRRPKRLDLLTDRSVREIHERLFGSVWTWAGDYRLTEKNIGVPVWDILTQMQTCLDDAKYWCEHEIYDQMEAAARFHHRLVWVHPFANGNGRWARIMADAYLAQIDQEVFLDWAGRGDLQTDTAHRTKYIAALRAADGYEFEPLIEFVRGIAK
ncbi:MAG: mobile mystery protein B [Proteobacteria bacterium]|nr:mobile mystery protein B [Pseudomonadota bacterium]